MKTYRDIVGDGGSGIAEQVAEHRRRIDDALSGVRHVLAVGSGKGGVGKSTLTLQLAAALRGAGKSVAVLDADLNGPSQARLAGLEALPPAPGPSGILTLPETASGIPVASVGSVLADGDALEFDTVAEGDAHVWRATREFSFLGQLVGSIDWGRRDFLLVDLPPGAERTYQFAGFLGPDAAFVLVTIPTALAHGVVARSFAALGKTQNRVLGYLENMAGYACPGCESVQPLFPTEGDAGFDVPCLGRIPFDPELAGRCDRGAAADATLRPEIADAAERIAAVMENPR